MLHDLNKFVCWDYSFKMYDLHLLKSLVLARYFICMISADLPVWALILGPIAFGQSESQHSDTQRLFKITLKVTCVNIQGDFQELFFWAKVGSYSSYKH